MKKLLVVILTLAVLGNATWADSVEFTMKRVGTFRSEACGVGDFNNDGKLDIVAGPYWYQAPDWKAHKYRELRGNVDDNGKGYWDDFMNIPGRIGTALKSYNWCGVGGETSCYAITTKDGDVYPVIFEPLAPTKVFPGEV